MIVSQVSSLPGVADGQAGRCRSPGKGTLPIGAKPFFRPAPRTAPAHHPSPISSRNGMGRQPAFGTGRASGALFTTIGHCDPAVCRLRCWHGTRGSGILAFVASLLGQEPTMSKMDFLDNLRLAQSYRARPRHGRQPTS